MLTYGDNNGFALDDEEKKRRKKPFTPPPVKPPPKVKAPDAVGVISKSTNPGMQATIDKDLREMDDGDDGDDFVADIAKAKSVPEAVDMTIVQLGEHNKQKEAARRAAATPETVSAVTPPRVQTETSLTASAPPPTPPTQPAASPDPDDAIQTMMANLRSAVDNVKAQRARKQQAQQAPSPQEQARRALTGDYGEAPLDGHGIPEAWEETQVAMSDLPPGNQHDPEREEEGILESWKGAARKFVDKVQETQGLAKCYDLPPNQRAACETRNDENRLNATKNVMSVASGVNSAVKSLLRGAPLPVRAGVGMISETGQKVVDKVHGENQRELEKTTKRGKKK